MSSIDDAIKQIKKLQGNLKKVDGKHSYSLTELFDNDFVSQHTKYSNISDFLDASGFDFESQEAFQNIGIEKFDKFISENSDFSSWEEMKSLAAKIIIEKQIYS